MLSSKIFKFTGILDNDEFVPDFLELNNIEEQILRFLLDLQLNEKLKEHNDENLFNHFEEKGINLNEEQIRSVVSILFFIENFYNKHPKYINEIENVKQDIEKRELIDKENEKNLFNNLDVIYKNLKDIRIINNIKSYKENFLPTIENLTYSTNIKMIKNTLNSYSNNTYEYDEEIVDFISSTTLKIELYNEDAILIQLSKDNIEEFIKVLEYAKKDISKSNELINQLIIKK